MSVEIIEAVSPEQIEQFRALLMRYAAEREGGFSEHMTQDLRDLACRYAVPRGGLFLALCDGQPVATAAWAEFRGISTGATATQAIAQYRRHGLMGIPPFTNIAY